MCMFVPSRMANQSCSGSGTVGMSHLHLTISSQAISLGNQIMIAGRSPRMIFSHRKRLVEPNLPKYMPFKRIDHFLVLEFEIPMQVSLSTTQSTSTAHWKSVPSFSLQASSPCFSTC